LDIHLLSSREGGGKKGREGKRGEEGFNFEIFIL